MNHRTDRGSAGFRMFAVAAAVTAFIATAPATAETVATVNGTAIDSSVLDFYIQSRTQRPADQTTAEQRSALLTELTDIYLLSTGNQADAVRESTQVQAQIELQIRSLVAQNVATQYLENLSISDEEIATEYARQAELAPSTQYKARHILVETQGEAAALIAQLDGGADFATLAQENSTGPSAPNGGDLGWFSPNQMVAPFSAAVTALENGAYSKEPVQTDFGWHVILREDSRTSEPPPLDSVRETIVQAIRQRRLQQHIELLRSTSTE